MNAEEVVWDLLEANIINQGDLRTITATKNITQQNKILYRCLKDKCTLKALRSFCAIIMAVEGNPKMAALGKKMMTKLETETGVCVCVLECECGVRVRVCLCALVNLYVSVHQTSPCRRHCPWLWNTRGQTVHCHK